MLTKTRLRIAIQKKGRLNLDSDELLTRCGLSFAISNNSLVARCKTLSIDILLVRDDDIPTMVMDNACDVGIVGENVLFEKQLYQQNNGFQAKFDSVMPLGFGRCRLSIAVPDESNIKEVSDLQSLNIATSYPFIVKQYLDKNNITAGVVSIAGSVELMPRLGVADVICDLVSTGKTLEENDLKESFTILESQAVLIRSKAEFSEQKQCTFDLLLRRIQGVIKAKASKYILFHAPLSAVAAIKNVLPGIETPTILPLEGCADKVAVHLVSAEAVFWDTLEKIKAMGASSILVLPIEKMMS